MVSREWHKEFGQGTATDRCPLDSIEWHRFCPSCLFSQARYACELMACRGVRVAKDVTHEWSEMSGGLMDKIEGESQSLHSLDNTVQVHSPHVHEWCLLRVFLNETPSGTQLIQSNWKLTS
jgi:hypothetical protein